MLRQARQGCCGGWRGKGGVKVASGGQLPKLACSKLAMRRFKAPPQSLACITVRLGHISSDVVWPNVRCLDFNISSEP